MGGGLGGLWCKLYCTVPRCSKKRPPPPRCRAIALNWSVGCRDEIALTNGVECIIKLNNGIGRNGCEFGECGQLFFDDAACLWSVHPV